MPYKEIRLRKTKRGRHRPLNITGDCAEVLAAPFLKPNRSAFPPELGKWHVQFIFFSFRVCGRRCIRLSSSRNNETNKATQIGLASP